jgi:LmbE family N-acetylglucosaminyl deacetylase
MKLRVLLQSLKNNSPNDFTEETLRGNFTALVAAPHPDDFDAIGVTLKRFVAGGGKLHLAVFAGAWSGVEDIFCEPPAIEQKVLCRELEQQASCHFFGLPDDALRFLRMREDSAGVIIDSEKNLQLLKTVIDEVSPDIVFMPHGNDSNADHRIARSMIHRLKVDDSPFAVICNRDPKTIAMQDELITWFDADDAAWKAQLLRHHVSQHQRNLNIRGYGFDERILKVNREIAANLGGKAPFAESFEIFI